MAADDYVLHVTLESFHLSLYIPCRLKVNKCTHSYVDTESSTDGLSNPVYFNNGTSIPHSNGNTILGNPYYTNKDRIPAGKRVHINKNSTQTTV